MVLKVPFSGAAGITATWSFNGSVITSGGRHRIVTSAKDSTLTVDNFQEEDCGNYEVNAFFAPLMAFLFRLYFFS